MFMNHGVQNLLSAVFQQVLKFLNDTTVQLEGFGHSIRDGSGFYINGSTGCNACHNR